MNNQRISTSQIKYYIDTNKLRIATVIIVIVNTKLLLLVLILFITSIIYLMASRYCLLIIVYKL